MLYDWKNITVSLILLKKMIAKGRSYLKTQISSRTCLSTEFDQYQTPQYKFTLQNLHNITELSCTILHYSSLQHITYGCNNKMSFIQEQVDIDVVLSKLLDKQWSSLKIQQREIRSVCMKARELFLEQPMLLQLEAPVKICGDIHGQYSDLLKVFEYGGYPGDSNYLFIGDYVDRGKNSIECIMLLLCYKLKFPENFFLLRGNHENSSINRIYGFYDECKRRYNLKIWKYFLDVFNAMPVCAVIDDKIICMHGGLSPDLNSLSEIEAIKRPIEVPDQGLLCDLLWSDPNPDIKGWGENQRGISYTFGEDVVAKFLKDFSIDLVCRAHQVVQEGYEFSWNRKLVTIFTAPNYCGQFQNNGAFMNVDENLVCSFQILRAFKKLK